MKNCQARLPLPTSRGAEDEPELIAAILAALTALPVTEFSAACETCPELCLLRAQIGKGWPNPRKAVAPELASYFALHHELAMDKSYVLRWTRLIVPLLVYIKVVNLEHESHQNIARTIQKLRDYTGGPRWTVLCNPLYHFLCLVN